VNTKLSFLFLVFIFVAGCKKENFETKPRLEVETIRVYQATCNGSAGGFVEIDLNVLDKEGDVTDSIFIQKIDAASIPCPANSILKNLDYKIPEYPVGNTQKVQFRVKFSTIQCQGYALIGGSQCSQRKDTSSFRFWAKDMKGNVSDTLTTAPIAIP
jgi:hypothetical protein